jgi:hypothetical protein
MDAGALGVASGGIYDYMINEGAGINSTKVTNWENDQIILAGQIFG